MATSQIPIVGEPFKDYVKTQIDARQKVYGSGFNQTRTAQEMSYLNSKSSWIKLASSVEVENIYKVEHIGSFRGIELAKRGVLFNGITEVDPKSSNYSFKSGVATQNSNINNSVYGFGGTDFGLSPMPGIIDFDVRHENRGSIRTGTLNIRAYNKIQFDIIETLYLRLGFTCLIEWGNSKVLNNDGTHSNPSPTLIDKEWWGSDIQTSTHLGMLDVIEKKRESSGGNYDAFFSRVVNYNWTFDTDGTYNIKINFASLGDVVESFKMSTLSPKIQITSPSDNETQDDKENLNSIHQLLKDLEDKEILKPGSLFNKSDNSDLISLKATQKGVPEPGLVGEMMGWGLTVDPNQTQYIRLGYLSQLIWTEQMTYFQNNGSGCFPLIDIDLSTTSRMNAIENLISVDPGTCVIKPIFNFKRKTFADWYFDVDKPFKVQNEVFAPFFVPQNTTYTLGIINNIYLNFAFLKKIAITNSDKDGNLSIYNFYTSILNAVNTSFGNICDLKVTIDAETNKFIIRDENVPVSLTPDCDFYPPQKPNQSGELEIFGFNNNKSNFVKSYTIETLITNELKNQLAIGATANNATINEESTAFSVWNRGLLDRFQQNATTGVPDGCNKPKPKPKPKEKTKLPGLIATTGTAGASALNYGPKTTKKPITPSPKSNRKSKIELYTKLTEEYYRYIKKNLTYKPDTVTSVNLYSNTPYWYFDPEIITNGKSLLKNYIIAMYEYNLMEEEKKASSLIGFIPINLSLVLEGISGLKIFNELTINQKFLPNVYPEIMKFVIVGVDHKLNNNEWVTEVRAQSKPKSVVTLAVPTSLTTK